MAHFTLLINTVSGTNRVPGPQSVKVGEFSPLLYTALRTSPDLFPVIVDEKNRLVWAHPVSINRALSWAAREADRIEATRQTRKPRVRKAIRYPYTESVPVPVPV